MNINDFVNQYGEYGPFLGLGRTNHLPMVQYALNSFGCKDEALKSLSEAYVKINDPIKITDYSLLSNSLEANLGQ